jgi:hypothetical protein
VQTTYGGGTDAFVAEINVPASSLIYASYMGGSGYDSGQGIAVQAGTGSIYVTGATSSGNFPTKNPIQAALAGVQNAFVAKPLVARFTVVDVMPKADSGEADQNSESDIAVSPSAPQNMVTHAFNDNTGKNEPYYTSPNGGLHWDSFWDLDYADATVAWSPSQMAYTAILTMPAGMNPSIEVYSSPNPQMNQQGNGWSLLNNSTFQDGPLPPDQPHVAVTEVNSNDQLYVGFNDENLATGAGGNGKTASIWYSLNPDAANPVWTRVIIETVVPGAGQDGPGVVPAVNGNTVYAAFLRWTAAAGADYQAQLVVVRDEKGGTNSFTDLNKVAVAGIVVPGVNGTKLGLNRLACNVAIAVDPNNANRVVVGYVTVNNGQPQVHLTESTDGGKTWNVIFNAPTNTAIPEVAIDNNGTIGLLYTQLANGNLATHFSESANDFGSRSDDILATFPNGSPAMEYPPYIGDYEGLVAIGTTFYGSFNASNNPVPGDFPRGVFYQRRVRFGNNVMSNFYLTAAGGTLDNGQAPPNNQVDVSIDPFFFSVTDLLA